MSRKGNNKGHPQNEPARDDSRSRQEQSQPRNNPAPDRGNGNGNHSSNRAGDGQVFSSDEIAERAYQIFEREGRMDGRDQDHWLQAERELRMERERRGGEMTAQNAPRSARQHQQQPQQQG